MDTKIRGFSFIYTPFSSGLLHEKLTVTSTNNKKTEIPYPPSLIVLDSDGQLHRYLYIDIRYTKPIETLLMKSITLEMFESYKPQITNFLRDESDFEKSLSRLNKNDSNSMANEDIMDSRANENKNKNTRDTQQTLDSFLGRPALNTTGFQFSKPQTTSTITINNKPFEFNNSNSSSNHNNNNSNNNSISNTNIFMNNRASNQQRSFYNLKGSNTTFNNQESNNEQTQMVNSNNMLNNNSGNNINNNGFLQGSSFPNSNMSLGNQSLPFGLNNMVSNQINQPNQEQRSSRDAMSMEGNTNIQKPSFLNQIQLPQMQNNLMQLQQQHQQNQQQQQLSSTSRQNMFLPSTNTSLSNQQPQQFGSSGFNMYNVNKNLGNDQKSTSLGPQVQIQNTSQNAFMLSPKHIIKSSSVFERTGQTTQLQNEMVQEKNQPHIDHNNTQRELIQTRLNTLYQQFLSTKLPSVQVFNEYDNAKQTNTIEEYYKYIKVSQKNLVNNLKASKDVLNLLKEDFKKQKNNTKATKEQLSLPLEDISFVDHKIRSRFKEDVVDEHQQALKV